MSRREDESVQAVPGYKEANYPYIPLAIEARVETIVGDFEITDVDIFALYGSSRVTAVPAGSRFEIHAKYKIQNGSPGALLGGYWTTCMTVWDVTRGKAVGYDIWGSHYGGGVLTAEDAVNVVMPASATTFRVKIFANQLWDAPVPPESTW
jgi:hypothetical protein